MSLESPKPMVVARSLTKTYPDLRRGAVLALDHIDFHALEGEVFGLLGPNGAGKSTALRILSTVLQPTDGVAQINGFDCLTQPALVRHQIGFISGNSAVYDRMTAWEMVEYFARLHGMEEELLHSHMESLFERLRMQDIRDVLGAKMSTGMKQKVLIALALVHDPPVLIFDEATNGLDVLVARALADTIGELRDQGKCIIFSTHIMREAERLCDRVAIINRGRILAEGTLDQLRREQNEDDLEELFYQLIRRAEAEHSPAVA